MRRAVLVLTLIACAAPRAPLVERDPGLAIAVETHVRDVKPERLLLVVDGWVAENRHDGTLPVVRLPTLPEGEHTIQFLIEESVPCGLGENPRGKVVVKASRTFVLEPRQRALVMITLDEGSVLRPIEERIHTRWRAVGDGISEADGCDFGAWVTIRGCDLPRPREAPDVSLAGKVHVLGEVKRPGTMTTWSAPTVAQAICRAGGKTVFASHRARVRRANRSLLARWEEEDMPLEPDDIVFVEPICAGY